MYPLIKDMLARKFIIISGVLLIFILPFLGVRLFQQKLFLFPNKISLKTDSALASYLGTIKLPDASKQTISITKNLDNYTLKIATSSSSNQTITFQPQKSSTPLSITPLDNRTLGKVNTVIVNEEKDGKITYKNIYNGVNLIYTPSQDKLLEEYELKNKRSFSEIIQKIDLTGLNYEKQSDGSILFFKSDNQRKEFVFAIPKPVMYEKGDSRQRSYGLHYELFEQNGVTYLVKVIDQQGQNWLNNASYPVMIDSTIFLTLFGFESYPVVENKWQIRLDTVGLGDLIITPVNTEPDFEFTSLTCGEKNIPVEHTDNSLVANNFSCADLSLLTLKVLTQDPNKQLSLKLEYGQNDQGQSFTTIVTTSVYTDKPVILSASVNPPTPKVGDQITIRTNVADLAGIQSVQANMAEIETITLSKISGTITNGVYEGNWIVRETTFKQYPVTLIVTNNQNQKTISQITIFDAYTCLGGGDHGGLDWAPADDCANDEVAGTHTGVGTLNIAEGATVYVEDYNGTSYGSVSISATTININGAFNATARGFRGGC